MVEQGDFGNVDGAAAKVPAGIEPYLDYLREVRQDRDIKAGVERSLAELGIQPGDRVIEVGCGLGDTVEEIARRVGASGRVVGVDNSVQMVMAAQREHPPHDGLFYGYRVGDAMDLSQFADGSFDRYGIWRTLQHVPDPAQALSEAARVVRSGGTVVALEPDWTGLHISGTDPASTEVFVGSFERRIRNPAIGSQLPELFERAGLSEVRSISVDFSTEGDTPTVAVNRTARVVDFSRIRAEGILAGEQLSAFETSVKEARRAGLQARLPLRLVVGTK